MTIRSYGDGCELSDAVFAVKGRDLGGTACKVEAVRNLQIVMGCIIVADQRESIGPDRHRTILTDIILPIHRTFCHRTANNIPAMDDFQVPVRGIIVTDQREPIGTDGDGGKPADIALADYGGHHG